MLKMKEENKCKRTMMQLYCIPIYSIILILKVLTNESSKDVLRPTNRISFIAHFSALTAQTMYT